MKTSQDRNNYGADRRFGSWRGPRLACAAIALLSSMPAAHAAVFGEVRVQSQLGQPLRAEIDIKDISPEDAKSLKVGVAGAEAYGYAGMSYPPEAAGMTAQIVHKPDGSFVARLRSTRAVQQPMLELLLDMRWASGRQSRAIAMLVEEPPGKRQASREKEAPVVAPSAQAAAPAEPKPEQPAQQGNASAPQQGNAAAAPGGSYTVQRGDHLYRIAEQAATSTPSGGQALTVDQLVAALYHANPHAFINGNMNLLKEGAVLSLPSRLPGSPPAPAQAQHDIVVRNEQFESYRDRLAGAATTAPVTPDKAHEQRGSVTARVREEGPAAGPRDELRLSKPESAATSEAKVANAKEAAKPGPEDEIARQRQLRETEQRLSELRKNVGDMQKLLESKIQQLAQGSPQQDPAAPPSAQAVSPAGTVGGAALVAGGAGAATVSPESALAGASASSPQAGAAANVRALLTGPWLLPGAGVAGALLAGFWLARRRRPAAEDSWEEVDIVSTPGAAAGAGHGAGHGAGYGAAYGAGYGAGYGGAARRGDGRVIDENWRGPRDDDLVLEAEVSVAPEPEPEPVDERVRALAALSLPLDAFPPPAEGAARPAPGAEVDDERQRARNVEVGEDDLPEDDDDLNGEARHEGWHREGAADGAAAQRPAFDMSSISLDLDPDDVTVLGGGRVLSGTEAERALHRKLELAHERLALGDRDGAAALLHEIETSAGGWLGDEVVALRRALD
ncbi:type IV pilus assembly protein FimV [Paracidovorax citrulli]